ncbi:MAG: DoxX family protein [Nanoarchaeota archaeon]|nr:DoxX family protein [Nanoarchaeota archaeon]
MKKPNNFFDYAVIFLGLVFLSAGVYRILNFDAAIAEMAALNMPDFIAPIMIMFEIVMGILFLLSKGVKIAAVLSAIFLISAVIIGFIVNGSRIFSSLGELFVFNANPTDISLHLIYLALLLYIFVKYKK